MAPYRHITGNYPSQVPCDHKNCKRVALGIVSAAERNNSLKQTHDCCSKHRGCKHAITPYVFTHSRGLRFMDNE